MSLSKPQNPVFVAGTEAPATQSGILEANENATRVNQLHGIAFNNALGAGIPNQVAGVQASIANAQTGSTCSVSVLYRVDPTDKNFAGVNIWVKGYQGNNQLVRVASGVGSPTTFVLTNTGEIVSFVVQAYGNGGSAPLTGSPTCSGTLPKSTTGGFGTQTISSYSVSNPPPSGGAKFNTSGQGYFLGANSYSPVILDSDNGFSVTNGANKVFACQLILESQWTISALGMYVVTAGGAGGHMTCALYDATGSTKVIDAGTNAFDTSSHSQQYQSVTLGSPVTLQPGVYWFAWGQPAQTGSILAHQKGKWLASLVNGNSFTGGGASVHIGTAANAILGGAMPASLGVITPFNSSSSTLINPPAVIFLP